MGSNLLQIIRRNKFDLRLRGFFSLKHQDSVLRTNEENEFVERLNRMASTHESRVNNSQPKKLRISVNNLIRTNITQLKAEEKNLNRSHSVISSKKRLMESTGTKDTDSHGIRRNRSFGNLLDKSQLAQSLAGINIMPYENKLLSKIIRNLNKGKQVREDRRIAVLITDVSEIEQSRVNSAKITPPNFSQLISSITTK